MEKEKHEEDMFKRWGASTGTLSRRIIGASASMRNKYETSMQKGTIYLETSKILFLGDSGVGKTSLQRYFREKGFSEKYNITRGNEKHHVETAAVTDTWEDVTDPENEQQYAASYVTVKKTDSPSESQTAVNGALFDQHFKLTIGLLCVCVAFALLPFGLCSLKIIGCTFSTLFFPNNLPMGIRYAEGTALSIFYRYALIETLYADRNMQQRMNNPDLFLEFQLGVLCCGLVVGFVLGFGCRAGTSIVFSLVCLKSQGSMLNFLPVVFDILREFCLDFKHASAVIVIASLTLYLCQAYVYHGKINIKQFCLQVIVSNFATALIYQMINREISEFIQGRPSNCYHIDLVWCCCWHLRMQKHVTKSDA
ncbi:uncharacterized protein LOC106154924 [Lingula anatina]|uniref:Uncharacterized protein LOC106154924 n=1 Tax=Lingula anatina TaxID=7574 RepID=A0A2R2MS50_LINAN|nr:uncharacterized protein LOC106154924 [Lingula anatina]|eukprot:XP_023932953.1 uncharacterized protein LOC106154924 [Lingula anatina]